jgi:hypothetical protein
LNKKITAEKTAESAEEMNTLTGIIIGAVIEVHRILGPGLLESAYEACLAFELNNRGLKVERHQAQLTSYLKLSGRKVGLLLNLNVMMLKDGIIRIVNNF